MSYCGELCVPCGMPCEMPCPQPWANACSQLCVTSSSDSRAVIYPPPVVLTFPGPVLSSCPQESVVGSCGAPAPGRPLGAGGCLAARGHGSAVGLRGSILFGGYGGAGSSSRPYGPGCPSLGRASCSPSPSRRYSSYGQGSCGPC